MDPTNNVTFDATAYLV